MKRQKIYPRLCVIKNWGTSYGFNLTSRRFNDGQEYHYINDVAGGSSALHAGLRKCDRVIEVNGANIQNESHKQIVKRILINNRSVSLLVLPPEDFEIFRQSGYQSSALMPYATIIEAPDKKPNDSCSCDATGLLEKNGNCQSEDSEPKQYKLEDLVLRTDSWSRADVQSRNHVKFSGDSANSVSEDKKNYTNTNATVTSITSIGANSVVSASGESLPPFFENTNSSSSVTSHQDAITNFNIHPVITKRKNPRHLSKSSSLALKDKMKLLNEL